MNEITRNPLCWPNNVPRTLPHLRRRPQFKEWSIAGARDQLLTEINRLNQRAWNFRDESVILSTNLRLKLDGLPQGIQSEPADTGVAIYFNLRFVRNGKWHERFTAMSCDKWNKVAFNLTALAKDIDAQCARDRLGATTVEQSFRGYIASRKSAAARRGGIFSAWRQRPARTKSKPPSASWRSRGIPTTIRWRVRRTGTN